MSLLIKKQNDPIRKPSEVLCSSTYLAVKLYEKKTGVKLMSKVLFSKLCDETYQFS
jgi:hypothetical protein